MVDKRTNFGMHLARAGAYQHNLIIRQQQVDEFREHKNDLILIAASLNLTTIRY